jgi:hypothetical protein
MAVRRVQRSAKTKKSDGSLDKEKKGNNNKDESQDPSEQTQQDPEIVEVTEITGTDNIKTDNEKIKVDPKEKIEEDITINIINNGKSSFDTIIDKKTKPHEDTEQPIDEKSFRDISSKLGNDPEEARKKLATTELATEQSMTVEDLEDIAEFLIDGYEFGISELSGYISGEDSSKYNIPNKRLVKLKRQLTLLLLKHRIKITIEMVFAASMLLYSVPQIKTAFKEKKIKKTSKKIGSIKMPQRKGAGKVY